MVTVTRPSPIAAYGEFLFRHRWLLIVLGAHVLFWARMDQFISPHPDFIDHWVQSRVLSWSYYEHPPMVEWLIHAYTRVAGSTESALEGLAIGINLAILLAVYALAARTFNPRAALFTLLCLEATLYFFAGTPMVQIEQPLLLSWIGALAALLEYQRTGKAHWLLAMGLCAGLGALSKYTMVLFYLGGLAFVLLVPGRRRDLRNPWLYGAGVLSLLVFTPVLYWNATNDWASFRFQLGKAGADKEAFFGKHLLEFTIGYVILFSPVLALGGMRAAMQRVRSLGRADTPEVLLAVLGIVPIAFFSLAMVRGSFPDPKWANVGFLSFYLLLGAELDRRWEAGGRRFVAALLGGALMFNAVFVTALTLHTRQPVLKTPEGGDPTKQIVGWDETGRQISLLLATQGVPHPEYVISFLYPLASQMALHLPSQPLTFSLKRPERNLWSPKAKMNAGNTIVVCSGNECRWVRKLVLAQFGWGLETIGTVRTYKWGVPRQSIRVDRVIENPPPYVPPPKRGK